MSRRRSLSSKGLSLTFVLIMVLSVFAAPVSASLETADGGAQIQGGPPVQQLDTVPNDEIWTSSENVSVWGGSVFTLRPDTSDSAFSDAKAYGVKTGTTYVKDGGNPVSIQKPSTYVYKKGQTIPYSFKDDVSGGVIDGETVQFVKMKFENGSSIPQSMSGAADKLTDSSDVTASVVDEKPGNMGTTDFSVTPSESGLWTVALVTVDDGSGLSDDGTGNLSVDGNVTVVGMDSFVVHEQRSTIGVFEPGQSRVDPNRVVKPGETSKFKVEATGLSGNVTHTVVVFNESNLEDYTRTVNVTDRDNVSIETDIGEVNGTADVPDGTTLLGVKSSGASFSGTGSIVSLADRLKNTSTFENLNDSTSMNGNVTVIPGSETAYASMVTKTAGPKTNIDVPIPDSPDGDYVVMHIATEEDGTKTVTNREPLYVYQKKPHINVLRGTGTITKKVVTPGTQFTIEVNVRNYGTGDGSVTQPLTANGKQIATQTVDVVHPGTAKKMRFEDVSFSETGTYDLKVGGVPVGTVTVEADSTSGGGNNGNNGNTGGGGGGGGGGSAGPPPKASGTYDSGQLSLQKKFDASLPEGRGVSGLVINFGDLVRGQVTVREQQGIPGRIGMPDGVPVSWLEIHVPDEAEDSPATLSFSIKREQLDELGATASDLQVVRYNDETGEWERLDTRVIEKDDDTVTLEADTPGFSYFGVVAMIDEEDSSPEDQTTTTTEEFESDETTTTQATTTETTEQTTTSSGIPGFGVTVAVLALIAIAFLAVRRE